MLERLWQPSAAPSSRVVKKVARRAGHTCSYSLDGRLQEEERQKEGRRRRRRRRRRGRQRGSGAAAARRRREARTSRCEDAGAGRDGMAADTTRAAGRRDRQAADEAGGARLPGRRGGRQRHRRDLPSWSNRCSASGQVLRFVAAGSTSYHDLVRFGMFLQNVRQRLADEHSAARRSSWWRRRSPTGAAASASGRRARPRSSARTRG